MTHPIPKPDQYQEMREALRDLCSRYDSAYWQQVDHERGYPEAFVNAITEAGWLAALIPEQYGGSGLGLAEASVIMEEINFSGGNAGSCHGQMYVGGFFTGNRPPVFPPRRFTTPPMYHERGLNSPEG